MKRRLFLTSIFASSAMLAGGRTLAAFGEDKASAAAGKPSVKASAVLAGGVVSQTVFTDELLLAVAEPGQIAALSHLARDAEFSAIPKEAAALPALPLNADAEAVLRYRPALVLFCDFSRAELVEQVRRSGVEIMMFERYHSMDEVFACMRRLAKRLGGGAEKRAEAVVADCRARLAALEKRMAGVRRVRVISPSTFDIIPGDGTNFQDCCDHAGAENLAKTLGGLKGHVSAPGEKMLRWPVEKVVVIGGATRQAEGALPSAVEVGRALVPFRRLTPYRYMAAVREGRAALLASWQSSCISHHRVSSYEYLARQLHPAAFAATAGGASTATMVKPGAVKPGAPGKPGR
jgi:iron complex transport system substrate-binding protein